MLSHNFLRDMNTNLKNMQTLQQQMTSGKEIRRPSDDPFKVSRAMQMHTDIDANKQYNENIKDVSNWLDTTDTALGQAGDVFQRVRELLISAGNASYGPTEKKAIKDEINQKVGELAQILNTNFDGKYIFGGTRGNTKPVDSVKEDGTNNNLLVYCGRDSKPLYPDKLITDPAATPAEQANDINEKALIGEHVEVEISQGVKIEYTVSASDIMNVTTGGVDVELKSIFKNITDHLDGKIKNTAPPPAPDLIDDAAKANEYLMGSDLTAITDTISNLLKIRSEVGAKSNRMDSALAKNTEENFNMTEILSKTEDIDITEKTMEYATMQTVYVASLQTSAKVIQPSLMDYLR
jgi:flagellar hook-associated protein 3 FlgL